MSATIKSLRAAYAAGRDPVDVIASSYRRLEAADDPGIFITLVPEEEALSIAARLGRRDEGRPLWGMPFAVKDNLDVAGLPTTAACPGFTYMPSANSPAVQHLLDAGAIVIGKTNLDQFATGLVGLRTPYPVPRNPHDPAIIPGGSSSGSAVAVARGIVPFALGTDTAGSGRVPAGLNGIVGLKPSLGAVSSRGMVPACRSLDTVSVFANAISDAREVFDLIAGYDREDAWSRDRPVNRPFPAAPRIGVPAAASRRFGGDALSEAAFDAALALLPGPLIPVELSVPFAVAALLYGGPWVAERYQAIRGFIEASPEALHPVTRQVIVGAAAFSAADAFAGLYRLAELRRAAEAIWSVVDVLVVPTYPRPRTVADVQADPIGPNSELGTYTNFVNLLDLCALAIPASSRTDGFPSGVTLIAPAGFDHALAALGQNLRLTRGSGTPVGP